MNNAKSRWLAFVGVASLLITISQPSLGVDYASNIKLPESLKKSVAERENVQRKSSFCVDGCKGFIVTCAKQEKVSRADSFNGVSEQWIVGMEFASFNRHYNKYYDGGDMVRFDNTKSGWVVGLQLGGVLDTKNCTRQG